MEQIKCPKCGDITKQIKGGFTVAKSQRYFCRCCSCKYTTNKKGYNDETKQLALKIYYSGVSARGVGKILGISKMTTIRWIKKTNGAVGKPKNGLH